MTKLDAHYTNSRLVEIYDTSNGWSEDCEFYLNLAGTDCLRILDLGCGTGLLAEALALAGHRVTAVDPSSQMLEVARRRPAGHRVEWVCSTAQEFVSERRYDLIIMTGHAFQVFLEDDDLRALLKTMGDHLAPGGRIAFESRNPDLDWTSLWNGTAKLNLATGEISIETLVLQHVNNRIRFETRYEFTDETLTSQSELRFWTYEQIERFLQEVDLGINSFFGDWDQSEFRKATSREMIFIITAK